MNQIIESHTPYLRHLAYYNPHRLIVSAVDPAKPGTDLMTHWNPEKGEFMRVFSHCGYDGKPFLELTTGRLSTRRIGFESNEAAMDFVLSRIDDDAHDHKR